MDIHPKQNRITLDNESHFLNEEGVIELLLKFHSPAVLALRATCKALKVTIDTKIPCCEKLSLQAKFIIQMLPSKIGKGISSVLSVPLSEESALLAVLKLFDTSNSAVSFRSQRSSDGIHL